MTTSHKANGVDTSCYRRRGQNPWKLRRAERKNFAKSSPGVSLGDFCQPERVKIIQKSKSIEVVFFNLFVFAVVSFIFVVPFK